jgi:hypothetical protein
MLTVRRGSVPHRVPLPPGGPDAGVDGALALGRGAQRCPFAWLHVERTGRGSHVDFAEQRGFGERGEEHRFG